MSALPTRIEKEAGHRLTPLQIFDITAARERTLSQLLMLYISTGLLFMLLPGTFLGFGICWPLVVIAPRIPYRAHGFRHMGMLRSSVGSGLSSWSQWNLSPRRIDGAKDSNFGSRDTK